VTVCNTSVARIVTVGRSHVGADGVMPRDGVGFMTVMPGAGGEGGTEAAVVAMAIRGAVVATGALM